jgi:hypothetical protein
MGFTKGLLTARAHLSFLIGLTAALGLIYVLETSAATRVTTGIEDFAKLLQVKGDRQAMRESAVPLTAEERAWAVTAWKYFENNYRPENGLVNSADRYASTTLWDLGSYAMALLAARDLELIEEPVFMERMGKLLKTLAALPLVDGLLPNKAYHTETLAMTDYNNQPTPKGIGWSALDIARLGVPLTLTAWRYPVFTPEVTQVISHWKLEHAVADGRMQGATRLPDGTLKRVQEGRFGYEQYGAKSFFLFGLDVSRSLRYDTLVDVMKVSGQRVAYDARMPKDHDGTHNAVLSEPYLLEAIEFGLTATTLPLARALLQAQQNRFETTGMLTAVSEDNIDRPPYFVYYSVLNDRRPWDAFSPDGKDASDHRALSLKAAVGWAYVFQGDYPDKLREGVKGLFDPERGWYSGRYEKGGAPNKVVTANTNGIVLETLWYRARGPLMSHARVASRK